MRLSGISLRDHPNINEAGEKNRLFFDDYLLNVPGLMLLPIRICNNPPRTFSLGSSIRGSVSLQDHHPGMLSEAVWDFQFGTT
jgi:hypothetical protein